MKNLFLLAFFAPFALAALPQICTVNNTREDVCAPAYFQSIGANPALDLSAPNAMDGKDMFMFSDISAAAKGGIFRYVVGEIYERFVCEWDSKCTDYLNSRVNLSNENLCFLDAPGATNYSQSFCPSALSSGFGKLRIHKKLRTATDDGLSALINGADARRYFGAAVDETGAKIYDERQKDAKVFEIAYEDLDDAEDFMFKLPHDLMGAYVELPLHPSSNYCNPDTPNVDERLKYCPHILRFDLVPCSIFSAPGECQYPSAPMDITTFWGGGILPSDYMTDGSEAYFAVNDPNDLMGQIPDYRAVANVFNIDGIWQRENGGSWMQMSNSQAYKTITWLDLKEGTNPEGDWFMYVQSRGGPYVKLFKSADKGVPYMSLNMQIDWPYNKDILYRLKINPLRALGNNFDWSKRPKSLAIYTPVHKYAGGGGVVGVICKNQMEPIIEGTTDVLRRLGYQDFLLNSDYLGSSPNDKLCGDNFGFSPSFFHIYESDVLTANESYIYILLKGKSIKNVPANITTISQISPAPYGGAQPLPSENRHFNDPDHIRVPGVVTRLLKENGEPAPVSLGFNFGSKSKPNSNYDSEANLIAIEIGKWHEAVLFWGNEVRERITNTTLVEEIAEKLNISAQNLWLFEVSDWVKDGLFKSACKQTGEPAIKFDVSVDKFRVSADQSDCHINGDLIMYFPNILPIDQKTLNFKFKVLNASGIDRYGNQIGPIEIKSVQEYTHDPISVRPQYLSASFNPQTNTLNFSPQLAVSPSLLEHGKYKITSSSLEVRPLASNDVYTFEKPRDAADFYVDYTATSLALNLPKIYGKRMQVSALDESLIEYFGGIEKAKKHCRDAHELDVAKALTLDSEGKISCYTPFGVNYSPTYEPAFSTQVAADWFGRTNFLLANEKDFAMILRHRLGGDEPFEIAADKTLKIYDKVKSKDGVSDFIISYRKDPAQVGGDELRELDCANDASGITCACYENYTPEGCPLKPIRESITFSADEVNQVFKDRLDKMCAAFGCTKNWQKINANTSLQNKSYTDAADITDTFEKVKNTPKSHSADTYRSTDNVKIQRVNLFATTATRLLPQQLYIRKTPGSSDNAKSLMAIAAKLTFNDQKMFPTSNTLDINASDVKLIAPLTNKSDYAEGEIPIQQSCVGAPGVCFSIENGGVPGFSGRAKVDLISDYNVPITLSGSDYNTYKYTYSLDGHELQNVTYIRDNINCLKGAIGCNNFSILRHIKPAQ